MWRLGEYDEEFLVGVEAKRAKDGMDQLEKNVQT